MSDITVIKGNLPLILLSPHGGFMDLDEIPNRNETFKCSSKSGKCHKNKKTAFVTQNDGPLTEISHFIYVTINKLTGKMPYMVVNNIARHDLDVNRPCYDGAEVDHAEDIWNKYFSNIDNLVDEINEKYSKALLIDLHSYEKRPKNNRPIISLGYGIKKAQFINPDDGMEDDFTLKKMISNNLPMNKLLYGKLSFGSILENLGLQAFPSNRLNKLQKIKNYMHYSGGYTVRRMKEKIPSIQIEFPKDLIKKQVIYDTCEKAASAIVLFMYINDI